MSVNSFWVFILSHNSPDKNKTYETLVNKHHYKGNIAIIIDDEDRIEEYKKNYKNVFVFSKKKYRWLVDRMINTDNCRTSSLARTACYDIARDHNIDVFLVLDDDYTAFRARPCSSDNKTYSCTSNFDIEKVFMLFANAVKNLPIKTIAFSQGGDVVGGPLSTGYRWKRKAMNSFFCKTDDPIAFYGLRNEDTNAFLKGGNIGGIFFSYRCMQLEQATTQSNASTLAEDYKAEGTYQKSFYSVMLCPSCVKVMPFAGPTAFRWHHRIFANLAYPKIISDKFENNN